MLLRFFFCSLLLSALGLWACRDDNPYEPPPPTECDSWNGKGLPPVTSSGCRTFGCFINGRRYEPHGEGFEAGISPSYTREHGLLLYINNFNTDQFFTIRVHPDVMQDEVFSIDTFFSTSILFSDFTQERDSPCEQFFSTSGEMKNGQMTIHRFDDSLDWVVSGEFSGTFSKEGCDQEYTITKARFDVKL